MPAGAVLPHPYAAHLYAALQDRFSAESVSSGVATAVATATAAAVVSASWWCCTLGVATARAQCSSSFVVSSRSEVFAWLKAWLAAQPEFASNSQLTAVQLDPEHAQAHLGGGVAAGLGFTPAERTTHRFRYESALASLELRRERIAGRQDEESLLLTLGSWPGSGAAAKRKATFIALVEAARELYTTQSQGRTEIFIGQAEYSQWEPIGTRRSRTMSSVILPQGMAEELLIDARRFRTSAQWYVNRGIPYRRGYLLHGTPGSGKTSLIAAMAGELQLNICILNLSNPNLDDGKLLELMAEVPADSLVVLEDVDAAFHQRAQATDRSNSGSSGGGGIGISFAGLLNAIDGVAAQEGRLLCLTTNHVELLDPALIRPGRIDKRLEFGHARPEQIKRLFCQFFHDEQNEAPQPQPQPEQYERSSRAELQYMADSFAAELSGVPELSMAAVQGHLLVHTADPHGAVEHASQLHPRPDCDVHNNTGLADARSRGEADA